ncbi:CPBP family intramembrane glutamic endopeptidase [Leucobacter luti]|uniref:CAAX prenyl protease-like protein n=1 Tax=Leucobacter luti TaxID=340320 RepID=A0A4R6RZ71_9MICO|nr:CPBP family intramembrane glutamic endopeptidase [Leucobacter luti]QYM75658.1 CPBP family intramembrane metalloprotease [Leucobacter luti]TDP91655.1 CAAX prenyl protease-like protein [Leucobacter luti]
MTLHALRPPRALPHPVAILAALLVCGVAPVWFVAEAFWPGAVLAVLGLTLAAVADRAAARAGAETHSGAGSTAEAAAATGPDAGVVSVSPHTPGLSAPRSASLLRDLSLIVIGLSIVRTISLAAALDNGSMVRFTLALGGAVAVPYLVSRYVYRDRATGFPWRGGGRWGWFHWGWLASVLVLGWVLLPWYFISSGVYQNWPEVTTPDLIARLFIGVGAVGIWDELFFICTVFAVLLRHFPVWAANVLQAIVFVSFLWELGYRSWGPLLTIPFALVQGIIFLRTRSLGYVVAVHLLFDAVVFAVLVFAHNPGMVNVFLTAR